MSDKCIITCHGYTGYPEEMEPFGQHFSKNGYEWVNLQLPGHGTTPEDLMETTWRDWTTYVDKEVVYALNNYDKVIFSGLSLGGAITLYALSHHTEISAGITLAAPLKIVPWYHDLLLRLPFLNFWVTRSEDEIADIKDTTQYDKHRAYDRHHVTSARQLNNFVRYVRNNVSKITQPLLIIHSKFDGMVDPKNAQQIYHRVHSQRKELVMLNNSGHVLTRDFDLSEILDRSTKFLEELGL